MHFLKKYRFVFFSFFILFGLFFSCEVGLGEAVDTQPPSVLITYPPATSIIRGDFVLAGTCSDDRSIKNVFVVVKDSENNPVDYEINNIEVDKVKKTWKVTINEKLDAGGGYPLKDGEYTFSATSVDDAGRVSSENSRSFKIDNTPPFFVIQSPCSVKIADGEKSSVEPTSYGSVLKFQGQIAEEHSVKYMKVNIYDKNKNSLLGSSLFEEKNINISGTTSVQFARYKQKNNSGSYPDVASQRYGRIYDSTDIPYDDDFGTKTFYCDIEFADDAGIYKTPNYTNIQVPADDQKDSWEGEVGNVTHTVYLNNSIYGSAAGEYALLGDTASKTNGLNMSFEIADLMRIKNGTYVFSGVHSEDEKADVIAKVLNILDKKAVNTSADLPLQFSLNPNANPKWQIYGYNFSKNTVTGSSYSYNSILSEATRGGLITLNGIAGLDQISFDAKTVKVWLLGPYEKITNPLIDEIYNEENIYYNETDKQMHHKYVESETTKNQVIATLYDGSVSENLSTDSTSWTKDLVLPDSEQILIGDMCYLFVVVGQDLDEREFLPMNEYCYGFKCRTSEAAPTVTLRTASDKKLSNVNTDVLKFVGSISSNAQINDASFEIIVTDNSTGKSIGIIKSNSISDLGIQSLGGRTSVTFEIDATKEDCGIWMPEESFNTLTRAAVTSPTSEVNYSYEITVSGRVGAKSSATCTTQLVKEKPTVEISTINKPVEIEKDHNYTKYALNGTVTLKGSAGAAVSLEEVKLTVSDGTTTKNYPQGTKTSITQEIDTTIFNDAPLTITLTAKDKAGNTNSYVLDQTTQYRYVVNQDTDRPAITSSNAKPKTEIGIDDISTIQNLFGTTSNRTISFTITDDDGLYNPVTIYCYKYDGGSRGAEVNTEKRTQTITEGTTSTSFSYELPTEEGIYEVVVEAFDIYHAAAGDDKKTYHTKVSDSYIVGVDAGAPTITLTSANNEFKNLKEAFTVTGKVQDSSEVVKIYKCNTNGGELTDLQQTITDSSTEQTWTVNVPANEADSNHTIYIYAVDKYGNKNSVSYSYNIDGLPPTVAPCWSFTGGTTATWTNINALRISVPLSDSYDTSASKKIEGLVAGINADKVYVVIDGDDDSSKNKLLLTGNYNQSEYANCYENYGATISFEDGKHTICVKASDNANHTIIAVASTPYNVDTQPPSVSNFTASTISVTKAQYESASPLTISATIVDTPKTGAATSSGIKSVVLKDGINPIGNLTPTAGNSYSYAFTQKDSKLKTGEHTYAILVTDNAGNEVVSSPITVSVDIDPPVVSINDPKNVGLNSDAKIVNGTIKISGTVSDSTKLSDKLTWKIDSTTGTVPIPANSSNYQWNFDLDTTTLTDKSRQGLSISATDAAGNSVTIGYPLYIDQSTDKPTVECTNASKDVEEAAIKQGSNLFDSSSNNKMTFNFSDDDALSGYKIVVKNEAGSVKTSTGDTPIALSGTSQSLSYTLPSDDGLYNVVLTVYDEGYDTASDENKKWHCSKVEYWVAVDSAVPAITNNTASGLFRKQGATVDITGTVTDSSDDVKVYRYTVKFDADNLTENNREECSVSDTVKTGATWSDQITTGAAGASIYYVAIDKYGRNSQIIFSYKVDLNLPTKAPKWEQENTSAWTNNTAFTYSIPLSDSWDVTNNKEYADVSGIKTVISNIDGVDKQLNPGTIYETTEAYKNKYTNYTATVAFNEGEHTVNISATDEAGNTAENLVTYKHYIDTTAPTVTVAPSYISKLIQSTLDDYGDSFNADNAYSIDVTIDDSKDGVSSTSGIKVDSIKVKDSLQTLTKGTDYTVVAPTSSSKVYKFKFNKSVLTTGTHVLTFEASDNAGNTNNSKNAVIEIDVTPPTLTYSSYTPYVMVDEKPVANGTISFPVTVSDETALADEDAISVVIKQGETTKKTLTYSSASAFLNQTVVINTKELTTESGEYTVVITAKDKVNNTTTESFVLKVDQSTDAPVIAGQNFDIDINDSASVNVTTNLFGTTSNNVLNGIVTDDDGVKTITVGYRTAGSEEEFTKTDVITGGKLTSQSFRYTLPADEGRYEIKITTTDTKNETENATKTSNFFVGVSRGAPTISITTDQNQWKNKDFSVAGTVSTNTKTVSKKIGEGTPVNITYTSGNASFSEGITVPSGTVSTVTITYTATDDFGQTGSAQFVYKVDTVAPTFKNELSGTDDYQLKIAKQAYPTSDEDIDKLYYNNTALSIEGYFTDEEGSGIESVYYTITPPSLSDPVSSSISASRVNTSGLYKFSGTIDGFVAGTNTLTFYAKDNVGNSSETQTRTVKIDIEQPTIEFVNAKVGTGEASNSSIISTRGAKGSEDIVITGKITDDVSGTDISLIEFYVGSSTYTIKDGVTTFGSVSLVKETANSPVYEFTLTIDADGKPAGYATGWLTDQIGQYVVATVKDNAGNITANSRIASLTIDTTNPTVAFDGSSPVAPITENKEINGKNIVIKGSASDDKDLESVTLTYSVSSDCETWGSETQIKVFTESDRYNWKIENFDTTKISSDETVKYVRFTATARDKAGNINSVTTGTTSATAIKVDQRTDRPIITLTTLDSRSSWLQTPSLSGNITDDDGTVTSAYIAIGASVPAKDDDWTAINKSTWTYRDLKNVSDGDIKVWFKIVDAAGNTFISASNTNITDTTIKAQPIYRYNETAGDNIASDAITIKKDTSAPLIYAGYSDSAISESLASVSNVNESPNNYPLSASVSSGGNKKYLRIFVLIYDAYMKEGGVTLDIYNESNSLEKSNVSLTKQNDVTKTVGSTTYNYYQTDALDISGLTAGLKTITITALDEAGNEKSERFNLRIDNGKPVITVTTDSSTIQGNEAEIRGQIEDDSSISIIGYYIPTSVELGVNGTPIEPETESTLINKIKAVASQQHNGGTAKVWSFKFDGKKYDGDNNFQEVNPRLPSNKAELASYSTFIDESDSELYNLPILIYAEDVLGNYTLKTDFKIKYDPYSDRPRTEITYPDKNLTLSGRIRVSGSATDNVKVSSVYLQIDANNDGEFNNDDISLLEKKNYVIATKDTLIQDFGIAVEQFEADENFWGILTNGSESWNYSINGDREFQKDENGNSINDIVSIKVRAVAFDNNNLLGRWTAPVLISIDPAAPSIGGELPAILAQNPTEYDSINGLTADASRAYVKNMYLKGKWYFVTSVSHSLGISKITYSTGTGVGDATSKIENLVDSKYILCGNGTQSNPYIVKIPLFSVDDLPDNPNYIEIYAEDKTDDHKASTETYNLKYDNTAPEIQNVCHNSTIFVEPNDVINDSNGTLRLSSDVFDEGSGVNKIAFYFVRNNIGIYDPMQKNTTSTNILLGDLSHEQLGGQEIYGKSYDVTRTTENTLNSPDVTENTHIRVGGLVKIGGTFQRITQINGNKITFEPGCAKTYTKAFFAYVQVVDNETSEGDVNINGTATGFNIERDDGDGMPETFGQTGNKWSWTANLISKLIPDGPIDFVMFAFDNAENISAKKYATSIQNNRPRIAKVMLATDLNGDKKFEYNAKSVNAVQSHDISGMTEAEKAIFLNNLKMDFHNGSSYGEFSYYSPLSAESSADIKAQWEMPSSEFNVVEGLCLLPEFVGGNGNLKYIMTQSSSSSDSDYTTKQTGSEDSLKSLVKENDLKNIGVESYKVGNAVSGEVDVSTLISSHGGIIVNPSAEMIDNEGKTYLAFTFWDETQQTIQGSTSQWAHLQVPIKVLSAEGEKPVPSIKEFYWNSKNDNSVYFDSDGNNIKGHIELPKDLSKDKFDKSEGLFDCDPKVSGKIVIEGTVTDNVRIETVTLDFDDVFTGAQLTYSNGKWNASGVNSSYGVESFTGEDEYISQTGHKMMWKLVCDTEKLSTIAAVDKNITVAATDWKQNSSASSSATSYRVDVVPYVTGIWTSLSEFYRSAPSVYARTATGKYPVREGETITIYGYNLSSGMTAEVGEVSLTSITEYTGESRAAMIGAAFNATIPTVATSGDLTITVNGVEASNNVNENNSKGAYNDFDESNAHHYNMQPNGVNNNVLNDDLKLDVWQFKTAATPKNGKAQYVTMKIDPATSMPGFSYANSILYFNMPGYKGNQADANWGSTDGIVGDKYSQIPFGMNYGGFSHNTFAFDKNGMSYGVAMCTDTQSATASAFFQFFSWETPIDPAAMNQNMNYHNAANCSRLDSSSVKISDWITNIDRIQSPVMDTWYDSTNERTYVYISYYDDAAKQVRLRWGTVGTDSYKIDGDRSTSSNTTNNNRPTNAYGLDDVVDTNRTAWANNSRDDGGNRPNNVDDSFVKYSGTNNNGIPIQIIASTGVNGASSPYTASDGATSYKAGKYVSLSMYGKVAIVSWYDEKNRKLIMAYNTDPTTGKTWTAKEIDSEAGLNVKTAVDADGGIHFAYYKSTGSDLKYAYLSSYDAETPKVCVVDSFGAVGAKCTIDVAKVGDNYVPYIGYQNNGYLGTQASAKVAYRCDFESYTFEGSDGKDFLTGKWEISVVPTGNIPNDDLINLGLSKTSAGVLQEFNKKADGTSTGKDAWSNGTSASFNNTVSAVGDATIVYANNTSNPVMGYGIDDGTIEMAQKK